MMLGDSKPQLLHYEQSSGHHHAIILIYIYITIWRENRSPLARQCIDQGNPLIEVMRDTIIGKKLHDFY